MKQGKMWRQNWFEPYEAEHVLEKALVVAKILGASLLALFLTGLIAFMFWLVFVVMPFGMIADARCLKAGYPRSAITYNLKAYCANLTGAVTVQVSELE